MRSALLCCCERPFPRTATVFSPKTAKELKDAVNACLRLSDDCSKGPHGPIGTWDVSQVTNMGGVFSSHSFFNGDISKWDVSRVTDMEWMFEWASSFNGDISKWDVARVTDMQQMFHLASSFNGDISKWDVSQVTDMQGMFEYATSFNGDISNWDVSRVTNMNGMFYYATSFNVDISNWDVSRVTNMNLMFVGATSFKHTPWATKDEFIRVKYCALCRMLTCVCTQLDTRIAGDRGLGYAGGGRGCICSKRYRTII